MILAEVPAGTTVFVDSNVLLFALTGHQDHGAACEALLDRIEIRGLPTSPVSTPTSTVFPD